MASLVLLAFGPRLERAKSKWKETGPKPFVIFFCSAAKARILYNFLGSKVHADVVRDSNGKFENRQFGNNACYHRIEDPSGKAADDFRCDLLLMIGDALSD